MLDVITEPSEVLHERSREVEQAEFNEELQRKLIEMGSTMYSMGGVGLAGPQVGDFRRILVADIGYAELINETTIAGQYGSKIIKMVNPKITSASGSMNGPEGCLSIPEFQQKVDRHSRIVVEYQDEFGEKHEKIFEDFLAVIIQHEIDHLDGVTLLDKAGNLKRSRYIKKVKSGKISQKAVGLRNNLGSRRKLRRKNSVY